MRAKCWLSLMAYVSCLFQALLILALSSKSAGNLICPDPITFVTMVIILLLDSFPFLSLQIDPYFGKKSAA